MLLTNVAGESKCPRGHLLILMDNVVTGDVLAYQFESKCPRGHLLILM